MGAGTVSDRTVELIGKLREKGVKFVIITGARSTTVIERMPMLPMVDAVACETGSKVWYPPPSACNPPDANEWELDKEWASNFQHVTGPLETDVPAVQREGTLWELFREMKALLFDPDSRGYTGCFRVRCKTEEAVGRISEIVKDVRKLDDLGIGHAMNLGMYDFFPKAAGKGNTVRYLREKWGLKAEECVALFDDDNDIPMARECGTGYLPSITSESVRSRLSAEPRWHVAETAGSGVFATEEILERLLVQVTAGASAPTAQPAAVS
eukprot:CAMPEP_0202822352 /NCGR_PEP_ID=MMETSP1389-20130828/11008_1 /ASSEMBLY_ACC=CAM_ASM_000865 /TAXON_ID=302021 /ORGANISM="Rhodomonas sp., Strain CCMP768" /LENGTH=267 /DNA_ID=CAMNT_0049495255 /DNA_START=42 /DNA_END=845 /DNA_ORIENTATION=-